MTSMLLLTNAEVFAPQSVGRRDLLLGAGRVLRVGGALSEVASLLGAEVVDLGGATVIPGLVDLHAHVTGGGGEAGPGSRVPPLGPSRFWAGGITTVVGLLGTDDVTRSTAELLAQVRGLSAEGLDAWCWTGGYHLPPTTLTGSVRGDLVHLDRVIGVGEIAISDHRSSQPTLDELLRIAADAHVGGLMTGKAGVLHLHVGDGRRGLQLIREALQRSEIPPRVFHPTHVNRRRDLWREACQLTRSGCVVDVTAFPPVEGAGAAPEDEDEINAHDAVLDYFERELPVRALTVSSDGGGCLPTFDDEGRVERYDVGDPGEVFRCLQRVVRSGLELSQALRPFTCNPADLLRFQEAGRVREGALANLVVLDEALEIRHVLARGHFVVRDGEVKRGRFE